MPPLPQSSLTIIRGKDTDADDEEERDDKMEVEKEKEEEEEDGDEEEKIAKKKKEHAKLDKSMSWFQPAVPSGQSSYAPINITASATTTTSISSEELDTHEFKNVLKNVLQDSVDTVRNEVLELLTKTVYSVARSLRPDPVRLCQIPLVHYFLHKEFFHGNHDAQ